MHFVKVTLALGVGAAVFAGLLTGGALLVSTLKKQG